MANIEKSDFKVEEPKVKPRAKKVKETKIQDTPGVESIFDVVDRIGQLMTAHRLDEVHLPQGLRVTKKVHLAPQVAPQAALTDEQKKKIEEAELFQSGM